MLVKVPAPAIPDDDPFKNDALHNRKESASVLTSLLAAIDQPFVLAINSEWGTGKSTFLQMWKKYLENLGYPCLYFNAWESDFTIDPMIAFIGEINAGMDELRLLGGARDRCIFLHNWAVCLEFIGHQFLIYLDTKFYLAKCELLPEVIAVQIS